jgi:hypothetical protein
MGVMTTPAAAREVKRVAAARMRSFIVGWFFCFGVGLSWPEDPSGLSEASLALGGLGGVFVRLLCCGRYICIYVQKIFRPAAWEKRREIVDVGGIKRQN